MFKFLDETVRGLIQFAFDLLSSTLALLIHPFTGATRLYRASRSVDQQQTSSITYLTLSLLAPMAVVPGLFTGPQSHTAVHKFGLGEVTGFLMTGSPPKGFAPYLSGAIAGAVVSTAVFRSLARLRSLTGRRRDRFIMTMEYQSAFFILATTAWLPFVLRRLTTTGEQAALAAAGLFLAIQLQAFMVQFWAGLWRTATPYQAARLTYGSWRRLLRGDVAGWNRDRQLAKQRALGYRRGDRVALDGRWMLRAALASVAILIPAALAGSAILVGDLVSEELLAQE